MTFCDKESALYHNSGRQARGACHGSQRAWFRMSSEDQFNHTVRSDSITVPIDFVEGTRIRPGELLDAMNREKWPGMVVTSRETRTQPASAAI